jgi:glycosyltransferase EpsE
MPRVSVIMGVLNGAATVLRAIRSIQEQAFTDWEYVICDDASTDGTWGVLQGAAKEDSRIRLIRQETNSGLAAALNRCIDTAEGEYLARQDADDVSHPQRFSEQVRFLDERHDVAVVGTYAALFDALGATWGELRPPKAPAVREWVRGSKVIHASVVMRAKDVRDAGKYNEHAVRSEDYDLWLRLISMGAHIATLPLALYFVHWDTSDYRRRKYTYRIIEARVRWKGYRAMKVPAAAYVYAVKPLVVGLLPQRAVYWYHSARYRAASQRTRNLSTLLEINNRPLRGVKEASTKES